MKFRNEMPYYRIRYHKYMVPYIIAIGSRGAGTILNVGGPTNQNKLCGKSRGTNT